MFFAGVSRDDVEVPSNLIKENNTIVVAIGVGLVNVSQINITASNPDEYFATTVDNFDALDEIVLTIVEQIRLCSVKKILVKLNYKNLNVNISEIVKNQKKSPYSQNVEKKHITDAHIIHIKASRNCAGC